jgi:ribosomal protein L37AE/L43A
MEGMSLYSLLDVQRGASNEEIRTAFRRMSKRLHPDLGGSADYFCELREAYGTLGDPERRESYDRLFNPPPPVREKPVVKVDETTPHGESVEFSCAICHRRQAVYRWANRFVCAGCNIAFRFGQCPSCKKTSQVRENGSSWACAHCSQISLSSWVTLARLKCTVCTTRVTYPRGAKRFSCPRCSARYSRCPKCQECVNPKGDLGKKKVRCPHCRKRFAR